jgi:hypothetical protein
MELLACFDRQTSDSLLKAVQRFAETTLILRIAEHATFSKSIQENVILFKTKSIVRWL